MVRVPGLYWIKLVLQAHGQQLRSQKEQACQQHQPPFPEEEIPEGGNSLFASLLHFHC